MLLGWILAKDAVNAGSALADAFPGPHADEAVREFLLSAAEDLRRRKLGFYRRVKFANAFKWRLLEKGIEARTAHDVTQTLLVSSLTPAVTLPRPTAKPVAKPALKGPEKGQALKRKQLQALFDSARDAGDRGDLEASVILYEQYLTAYPRHVAALNNLGVILLRLGRHEDARSELTKAVAAHPKLGVAHANLGNLALTTGQYRVAENHCRRAAGLLPADLNNRANLGLTLVCQGALDKAKAELDKVLRVAPRFPSALYSMGILHRTAGRFDAAEQMFRRALEADPNLTRARADLVSLRRMTPADSAWLAAAEDALRRTTAAPEQASLNFAMGKYFDDLGQYELAFAKFARANQLLKPLAPAYDGAVHSRFVTDLIRTYSAKALHAASSGGVSSTRPVFVIGMPRSGTSLVEQILTSHPAVAGIGESDFWSDVVRRDERRIRSELLPEDTRRSLAAAYLEELKRRCPDARYVVDKAPRNADIIGLIHSVFPHARFIYMKRDPIDTCLSCFFQPFATAVHFSFDLSDLAKYYKEHARAMAHWRSVVPAGTILDVPYEELVSDQDAWTRKLLGFLGLEWDERCLSFERNPRPVVTASYWQVRQPLYGNSVRRWKNYAKFIGPLRKLKPA